jgi:type IX secretion system substrate protein
MKKITHLFYLLLFVSGMSNAQCLQTFMYPSVPVTSDNTGIPQVIATCSFPGDYAVIENLVTGLDYVFTLQELGTDKYITVTDVDDNVLGFGTSPLSISAITTDQVKLHFSESEGCETSSNCHISMLAAILTCPIPVNVSVTATTTTTADFMWDAGGTELAWEVLVQPAGSGTPDSGTAGTAVITTTYSASGLEAAGLYEFYVRANCGSEFSPWSLVTNFATLCDPIADFDENADSVAVPALPVCWSAILRGDTLSEYASVNTVDFGYSAPNSFAVYNSSSSDTDDIILVSPNLSNLGAGTHRLVFYAQGGIGLHIGTLDTNTDSAVFTPMQEIITTGTFERYVVDFSSYSGTDTFIGIRHASTSTYYTTYIDNIVWELLPACPDVMDLSSENITSASADILWNAGGAETAWQYVYGFDSDDDPDALVPVNVSGTPMATINGLDPSTDYKYWVRSDCGAGSYGAWMGPETFKTACVAINTLPWEEGFESMPATGFEIFPDCWSEENGDWSTTNATTYNVPRNGSNYLRDSWNAIDEFMWTPGFELTQGVSYDFSYYAAGDGFTDWTVDTFVSTEQNSASAIPLGDTFAVPGNGPIEIQPYSDIRQTFVPDATGVYYFAIKVNEPSGSPWYIAFDDFKLELTPACSQPSSLYSADITESSATISWSGISADFEYVVDESADDPASGAAISDSSYSATGLMASTTYYFHIRSNCGVDGFSSWNTISFTTFAAPPANDECDTAATIAVGVLMGDVSTDAMNGGATDSPQDGTVACNGFAGGDIWYTMIVPPSGNVTIETTTDSNGDGIDTVLTAYTGTCDSLTEVGCDDDGSPEFDFGMSLLQVTGQNAGDLLYLRVYEYNNDNEGGFAITAYDESMLNTGTIEDSKFVVYPNPVKNILNLSNTQNIENVAVYNLIGQQVLVKELNVNHGQIDMSNLSSGTYFVKLNTANGTKTVKVLKQ